MNTGNGGPTRQDSYFLSPFMLKTREMAYPAPTEGRSKLSPNAAMLFAPFGCTHPPPPAPPFLLAQSLSLKDIAGCDIMKLKVSRCRYATLGLKGLRAQNSFECNTSGGQHHILYCQLCLEVGSSVMMSYHHPLLMGPRICMKTVCIGDAAFLGYQIKMSELNCSL